MTKLEQMLAQYYQKEYCVYTGNGTTAMYLAFLAMNITNEKVLFPAITCTNPVNAAIFAGGQVEFCDVKNTDFTIDEERLEGIFASAQYRVVVPTHIYGNKYHIDRVNQLCKKYNVLLLEDAAQTYDLSDSDISITSFGHTKIYESEQGGGAAFTNDKNLYERMKYYKEKLSSKPRDSAMLFDRYRKNYYSIMKQEVTQQQKFDALKELQLDSRDIFIYDSDENWLLEDVLKRSSNILQERREKKALYDAYLDKKWIQQPVSSGENMWRYSFLYQGNRKQLLEKVREHHIDISSWYPSVAQIYNREALKIADMVTEKIINLWVDDTHSKEQIMEEINIINDLMEECYDRP